jgi:hypothetical protein
MFIPVLLYRVDDKAHRKLQLGWLLIFDRAAETAALRLALFTEEFNRLADEEVE